MPKAMTATLIRDRGDGSGQFRARQTTAHSGLSDRNIEAQPV